MTLINIGGLLIYLEGKIVHRYYIVEIHNIFVTLK